MLKLDIGRYKRNDELPTYKEGGYEGGSNSDARLFDPSDHYCEKLMINVKLIIVYCDLLLVL